MSDESNSQTVPRPAGHSEEPIPGYRLIERVGVGGYGEVWKAEAPGGLTKAVKLVYGHLDDSRASREMKALNRIKLVRHPFLLSLERIEAVDGKLVIVTELAQSNIKELFVECQRAGMNGIPRDRLLGYLKDTADALDYICAEHQLQHLDIKPENLLLVGDRVKVADFGLVRELFDSSASMLGGLTPNYAPPEVFDGRPDPHSDQYSLAIVYQEMLTGVLPFSGRTAAQLAAQHMHSQPRLDSLPPADRVAVGRALSKDPAKRFPDCRAFIEVLMKPEMAAAAAVVQKRAGPAARSAPSKTISLDGQPIVCETLEQAPRHHEDVEMTLLPPVELSGKTCYRPTLFLGIGGMAAATLRSLRCRLQDRVGDLDQVPALQTLLLDTDRNSLSQACSEGNGGALKVGETLAMPLRRTQDYRSDSGRFLSWMSRRWIYNIPRSQQTEGLRPLGRLAMVDHADQLMQRIRDAIAVLSDEDTIKKSAEACGLQFESLPPRVFIVASVAGGTGSGMVLDVAYAVRQVLTEFGHPDDSVCGILTHHTDRRSSAHDLAVANTISCLQELKHYSQPASHYPGDAAMGLATFNGRTFHHGYLMHLGDELGPTQLEEAIDRVAEFMYCNSVTRSAEFFDRCRELEHQETSVDCPETSVRTFGLCQLGLSNSDIPDAIADMVAHRLVDDWRGGPEASAGRKPAKFSDLSASAHEERTKRSSYDTSVDRLAEDRVASLALDIDRLGKVAMKIGRSEMGRDPEDYLNNLVRQYLGNRRSTSSAPEAAKGLLDLIDQMLGTDSRQGAHENAGLVTLQSAVNEQMKHHADDRASALREWILELVDNSRGRIKGAQRATKWLAEHLHGMARKANDRAESLAKEANMAKRQLLDPNQEEALQEISGNPLIARYYRLRLSQVFLRSVAKTLRRIDEVHVAAAADQLRDLLRELEMLAAQFTAEPVLVPPQAEGMGGMTFVQYVRWAAQTALSHRSAEYVAQVESELFGSDGGLRTLLAANVAVNTTLADSLRTTSRSVIRRAVRDVNVAEVVLAATAQGVDRGDTNPLCQCVDMATPFWSMCGGAKRLLAIAPETSSPEPIAASFERYLEQPLNLVFDSDGDLVFCYEAEGLDLVDIAWALIDERPDLLQVASRLHTRIDVDWSAIV